MLGVVTTAQYPIVPEPTDPIAVALRSVSRPGEREDPRAIVRALGLCAAGAAAFGVALGSFGGAPLQMLSSAFKVPLLLFATTVLCFPAFHVLQIIRAARPLSLAQALALHVHAWAATALVWGALSLPLLFLATTVQHYRLAQLLALVVGALGGIIGLRRFSQRFAAATTLLEVPARGRVLPAYFVLHAVVGAQLSWGLRPFLGAPGQPFELVRGLRSNFFEFVLGPLWNI